MANLILTNELDTFLASATLAEARTNLGLGPQSATDNTALVYVSKVGSDANDGLTCDAPKLSIGSAITQAADLLTGDADNVRISILDGGRYTEDLTIPDDVHLVGHAAEIVGNHTIGNNSSLVCHALYRGAAGNMVLKSGASGHGHVRCSIADSRGTAGAITGGAAFRNASNGSVLHVQCDVLFVAASCIGVADLAGGFGHIHFLGSDIYLAGNSSKAIRTATAGSKMLVTVDHILGIGSPAPPFFAVQMAAAGSEVWVKAGQIDADTAWDLSGGGDLYISCPDIAGTRTGTPAGMLISTKDHAADAEEAHATSSFAEVNAALNALGAKINQMLT